MQNEKGNSLFFKKNKTTNLFSSHRLYTISLFFRVTVSTHTFCTPCKNDTRKQKCEQTRHHTLRSTTHWYSTEGQGPPPRPPLFITHHSRCFSRQLGTKTKKEREQRLLPVNRQRHPEWAGLQALNSFHAPPSLPNNILLHKLGESVYLEKQKKTKTKKQNENTLAFSHLIHS